MPAALRTSAMGMVHPGGRNSPGLYFNTRFLLNKRWSRKFSSIAAGNSALGTRSAALAVGVHR